MGIQSIHSSRQGGFVFLCFQIAILHKKGCRIFRTKAEDGSQNKSREVTLMNRVKATTLSKLGLTAVNIIPDLKKKMYIVVKHRSKIGKAEGMRNREGRRV